MGVTSFSCYSSRMYCLEGMVQMFPNLKSLSLFDCNVFEDLFDDDFIKSSEKTGLAFLINNCKKLEHLRLDNYPAKKEEIKLIGNFFILGKNLKRLELLNLKGKDSELKLLHNTNASLLGQNKISLA